ncbi:MAG: hypothetical protein ABI441_05570 [Flavobacterium sp.]
MELATKQDVILEKTERSFEESGVSNSTIFQDKNTGTAFFENLIYIDYGSTDDHIASACLNIKNLLNELKNTPHESYI